VPKTITQYSILISCPSDVQEELAIIEDVINEINRNIGDINGVKLEIKHWGADSYPESGGRPQKLLNKQFVNTCDMAIAVFWTRFGTPTDDYGSGTEEEIEQLLKDDKQVFLYFSDVPLPPSKKNEKEYQRVLNFKEQYHEAHQTKGLYDSYDSIQEFKKKLTNHLYLYVPKLFIDKNIPKQDSSLHIVGIKNGLIDEEIKISPTNIDIKKITNSMVIKAQNLIEEISKVSVQVEVNTVENKSNKIERNPALGLAIKHLEPIPVKIDDKDQEVIKSYLNSELIPYTEDTFFNVIGVNKQLDMIPDWRGNRAYKYTGPSEMVKKYEFILQLLIKIKTLESWKEYLNKVNSLFYLDLGIQNNGSTYDEDVDVTVYVAKNTLIFHNELPIPSELILGSALALNQEIYISRKSHQVKGFDNYPESSRFNPSGLNPSLALESYDEKIERETQEFNESLENIFCYELYEDDQFDIIRFNQSYIKQHDTIAFPSLLLFNKPIENIKVEITSKKSHKKNEHKFYF